MNSVIKPFPHRDLPANFSPTEPYWVYQENSNRWTRFQTLTEFMSWRRCFQDLNWDWTQWSDLGNYIDEDEPDRKPCEQAAEELLAQGATGMLIVTMAGNTYFFNLDDTASHPDFDAFAHRALCELYDVRRSAPITN